MSKKIESREIIPRELSDYIENSKARFEDPSFQRGNTWDLIKMFVLGMGNIAKNYVEGVRKVGHYGKKRGEICEMSYFDLLKFGLTTVTKPMALSYDLTSICNCSCPDCFKQVLNKYGERSPEINDETFLSRLEYVYKNFLGIPTFIMGGEPTIKPKRLAKALEIALEYKAPVKISSNNSIDIVERAKDDEHYAKLLKILQKNYRSIAFLASLEDINPANHERIRKGSNYHSSLLNTQKLLNEGVNVVAGLFINPKNYERFKEILDVLMNVGYNGAAVSFHTYVPRAGDPLPDFIMTEEHRAKASQKMQEILKEDHYGYFVKDMTPKSAEMFHPDNLKSVFNQDSCPTAKRVLSFDHRMFPLIPCSFGGEAPCSTEHPKYGKIGCGLWLPGLYAAAVRGEPGALKNLMREAFTKVE